MCVYASRYSSRGVWCLYVCVCVRVCKQVVCMCVCLSVSVCVSTRADELTENVRVATCDRFDLAKYVLSLSVLFNVAVKSSVGPEALAATSKRDDEELT